jgi:pilus assembly protein CpaC
MMALKLGQTNTILLDAQGTQIATIEVTVGTDLADLNAQIAQQLPNSRVKAEALNDNIVLGGTVSSASQASQAQAMAARVAGAAEKVVNGLKIEQTTQVMIKVRVSEIRTIAKPGGANFTAAIGKTSSGVPIFADRQSVQPFGRALADISGVRVGSVG